MLKDHRSNGSSPSSQLLVASDLRKSYGARQALRGLSFSLQAGRILGFLGPNGAGKTTAIRILTTMMEPDSGHFIVDGVSSDDPDNIRRKIGVLPENLGFPKQITGLEYLTYFSQLYGRSKTDAKAAAQTLLEDVGLKNRGKSLIGSYSHGMRQRLGIARALINDPVVVFLDEPTLGLDPRGQKELLALIRRITRERKVGVILCSHALWEIEVVCDDVVILNSGQVVASGSVADVTGRTQRETNQQVTLRIQVPAPSVGEAQRVLAGVTDVVRVTSTGETAGWLRVELAEDDGLAVDDEPVNNRILATLIQAKIPVLSLEAEGSRLHDVFLQLTEEVIK